MSGDFDPVEIRLDLIQNIDSEGKKSTAAIDAIAAASNKMKAQFEKDIAAQKALTTQLITELKLLKETMGKKVETGDDKQIVEKQKLVEQVDLLNKKLIEQEALLNRINKKAPTATTPGKVNTDVDAYARQVRSLNMSMTQISREMPNFAISPMIGIMSLSNNLPMLQGDITRMIELNKELKASGQATTPVFKQLISSLFSWQTALIAGISALMLWGPQIGSFISDLFKSKDALLRVKKAQEELTVANTAGQKNAQEDITRLELLYKTANDVTKSLNERNAAVNELQKTYPDYLGNIDNEAIKTGNAAAAYDKLRQSIIDAAIAKAYEKKITETQSKIIDLEAQRAIEIAKYNKQTASSSIVSKMPGGSQIRFGFGVALSKISQSEIENIEKEIDALTLQINEYAKNINITDLLFGGKGSKQGKTDKPVSDELENKIKDTKEKMNTALGKELKILAEKLRLLEKELDLRKQNIKAAEMAAWISQFDGQSMNPIQSKGISSIIQKAGIRLNAKNQLIEITAIDKTGPTYKKVGLETDKLNKKIKEGNEKAIKDQEKLDKEALDQKEKNQKKILDYSRQLTDELIKQLGLTEQESNLLNGFADTTFNLVSGDPIGAAFSVASMLLGVLDISGKKQDEANQKAIENKKILTDYLNEMIVLQVQYNIALNDQIELQNGQSVFINDYVYQAQTASKKMMALQAEYIAFLDSNRKSNIWLPDYGELKAEADKIKNILAYTLVKDPTKSNGWSDLLTKYPGLIKANGEFDASLAKTLLNLQYFNEETKAVLSGIIDYTDKLKEYKDQINSAIESIAGSISTNLFSALSNAWDAGTDSFVAFKDSVSSGLKDIAKQMLFNTLFAQDFITLQADMAASFAPGGDGSIIDDIARFYALGKDKTAAWDAGNKAIETQMTGLGVDTTTSTNTRSGSAKGIAQASQDSVDEMNGRMTAVQAYIYDIRNINTQSLDFSREMKLYDAAILSQLETIAENTDYCRHLESIDKILADIQLKGIYVKG